MMKTEDNGQRTKDKGQGHWTDGLRTGLFASVLCLLSFVLPAVAAPTNLSPDKTAADPVQLFSEEQYKYLYNMDQPARSSVLKDKQMETAVFCNGSPLTLSWKDSSGTCTVTVKRLLDGKQFWTGTTSGTSVGSSTSRSARATSGR